MAICGYLTFGTKIEHDILVSETRWIERTNHVRLFSGVVWLPFHTCTDCRDYGRLENVHRLSSEFILWKVDCATMEMNYCSEI